MVSSSISDAQLVRLQALVANIEIAGNKSFGRNDESTGPITRAIGIWVLATVEQATSLLRAIGPKQQRLQQMKDAAYASGVNRLVTAEAQSTALEELRCAIEVAQRPSRTPDTAAIREGLLSDGG
mmetsp:Transcript_36553/g.90675  ORF Transcript_36553/g.90675 Transcript_36553/m.90675 type:complete len:125 (-) Transcript_36553:246-620(-)